MDVLDEGLLDESDDEVMEVEQMDNDIVRYDDDLELIEC